MEKELYSHFFLDKSKLDPTLFDLYPLDWKKLKHKFPSKFNYKTKHPNYLSKHFVQQDLEITQKYLKKVQKLETLKPTLKSSLPLKVFKYYLQSDLEGYKHSYELFPISQVDNPYLNFAEEASGKSYYVFNTIQDFKDFLEKTNEFRFYSQTLRDRLKEGLEKKLTISKCIIEKVIEQLEDILKNKPYHHPKAPKSNPDYNAELDCLFGEEVKKTLQFLQDTYLHQARRTVGYGAIDPDMYLHAARSEVTLPQVKIEDLYQIGLQEVHKVDHKMSKILEKLLGKKFKNRSEYVKARQAYEKDPKNFFQTAPEALKKYQETRQEIQKTIIKSQFKGLKISHDFTIKPVPDHNADYHSAYYLEPNQDLSTKGTFFLNTKNPKLLARNEVLALCLHEGNPGHHFQLTHKLDHLNSLPEYIKIYPGLTAYIEGWGLYCETLGDYEGNEGLYQKYGQLKMEMLRSLRLVVDTGIHYYGWSLSKTKKYFLKYLDDSEANIDKELLRYAADPGQALAYKMGQLAFLDLQKSFLEKGKTLNQFHLECFKKGELPLFLLKEELLNTTLI